MENNLQEISSNAILEISCWGGLGPTPGVTSTIITNDKKIYYYHKYYFNSSFLIEHNIPQESLSNGVDLSDELYKDIIEFIEKNIVGKSYTSQNIMDASFIIKGTYNDQKYQFVNCIGNEKEKGIYEKTKDLILNVERKMKDEK